MSGGWLSSWFVEMILATSILMLFVLVVRQSVARYFGPRVAYALWLLPAFRAVLPQLPDNIITLQGGVMGALSGAFAAGGLSETGWALWLVLAWIAGASAFFFWHSAVYVRFSRQLRAGSALLFKKGAVKVARSPLVPAPLAFGVVDKAVILPDDFDDRYAPRERHFAIGHELMHHRRGDLIANVFALILLSLHWFNPIAHFAFRAFRADQEAACDASVLNGASDDDRHAYGSALVKSALGHAPLVACRISGASSVKARLTHIIAARETAAMHDSGVMFAGILIIAGLGITASGSVQGNATARPALPRLLAANQFAATAPLLAAPSIPALANTVRGTPTVQAPQPFLAAFHSAKHVAPQLAAAPVQPRVAKPVDQSASGPRTHDHNAVSHAVASNIMTALPAHLPGPRAEIAMEKAAKPVEAKPALTLAQHGCTAGDVMLTSEAVFIRGGDAKSFALVLCARKMPAPEVRRTALLTGLAAARDRIAQDEGLPIEARVEMIAMLEQQIRQIEDVPA
jgi:bla regulator protein blaR1